MTTTNTDTAPVGAVAPHTETARNAPFLDRTATAPVSGDTLVTPASTPPMIGVVAAGAVGHATQLLGAMTEAQVDLLAFLSTGTLPDLITDDPAFIADYLADGQGSTDDLLRLHQAGRAARLNMCEPIGRYIRAALADNARREGSTAAPKEEPTAGHDRETEARLIAWYCASDSNRTESDRVFMFAQEAGRRSMNPDAVETQRENARQLAIQAANELDYDDAMVAAGDPDWESGGVMAGLQHLYDLTDEETVAVTLAAQALRALPPISYREPVRFEEPRRIEEAFPTVNSLPVTREEHARIMGERAA